MPNYNLQQKTAITYPAKPLLILAGAGTGKTTTIVGRIAHFIQNIGIQPESILVLTFTTDAAEHMKNKLIDEIGPQGNDICACTFHSFAQFQSIKYYQILGYTEKPKLMNKGDIFFLIRKRFDDLQKLRSKDFRRNPIQAVQSFQKIFEAFRYNLLKNKELKILQRAELDKIPSITDDKKLEQVFQLADMVDVYPLYQSWKKELNWIDYGDMIINLWELILENPEVLYELQNQYQHIIVDEFQDNNYALSKIVEKIAEPENSITVVGDDDQCIYAFRQANIQNVHQFKARYYNNNHKPVSLIHNYRSRQPILNLANCIISQNIGRMNKEELISCMNDTRKPQLYIGTEKEQLLQISAIIKELLDGGEYPANIAILIRSNRKCRLVAKYLNSKGIRNYYHSDKLYEQPVIKDLLSLLNLWADSDKAEHAFLRLLQNIVGLQEMEKLCSEYAKEKLGIPIAEYAMSLKSETGQAARHIIQGVEKIKTKDTGGLVWGLLKVGKLYYVSESDSLSSKMKWESLNQFWRIVSGYCRNYSGRNPLEFINFINIQWKMNDEPLIPLAKMAVIPAIRIMTIHSAKGMEFKHVFIPFLRSGTFPNRYQPMSVVDRLPVNWQRWDVGGREERELHYEEERRLFYVAITRAMKTLSLFAPTKYQSPFIANINEKYVRKETIMKREEDLNQYDYLIGKYQVQLEVEISLGHFKKAHKLLDAIENINLLSKGIKADWTSNPLKSMVEKELNNVDILPYQPQPDLSATSIKTYQTCPLKYKYRYVDHIPGAPEKPYFQLGKVVHKVLEIFHKDNYSSLNDLKRILDVSWEEGGYQYEQEKEQNREDAEYMLKNYWNYIQNNPVNLLYTEHWFSFKTDNANLSGKCDRIDLDDGKNISIIDYKTSQRSKSENDLKKDLQLGIYALYASVKGIDADNAQIRGLPKKLTMIFLREKNPEVSIEYSASDMYQFTNLIRDVAIKIQSKSFDSYKGRHCEWCDYKDLLCPEFN